MQINRQGFLTPESLANQGAISGYSSSGTASTGRTSGRNAPDDVVSTSQLAILSGALNGVASAGEQRVEQLRLAYANGDYPLDLTSLAGNLAEGLFSDRG
jgi:anti-sigma28 factor (negative regulator of flagellin synthesis)